MPQIFSAPYWPTPEGPPQLRVELEIEATEGGIMIRGEVTGDQNTPLWAFGKTDKTVADPNSDRAKVVALFAMVDHLAQCLADARKVNRG